MLSRAFVFAHA